MASDTKITGQATDNLSKVIGGVFSVALAQKIAGVGVEMFNLGTEANAVEARFRELTDGIAGYDELMQRLRSSTLGVVDDLTLQQGATRMVQLANIDSAESLEKLMGIVVRTKQPQESLNEAVEKYARLLSSGSVMLLDNYGLSLTDVREETKLLMAANNELSQSQARTQAIINLSEENVRDLGAAADVASTAAARLGTRFENTFQDISQNVQMGADALLGFLEILTGDSPYLKQRELNTQSMVDDLTGVAMELLPNGTDISAVPPNFLESYLHAAVDVAIRSPKLAEDQEKLRQAAYAFMDPDDKVLFPGTSQETFDAITTAMAGMAQYIGANKDNLMAQLDYEDGLVAAEERRIEALRTINHLGQDIGDSLKIGWDWLQKQNEALAFQEERKNVILSTYMSALGVVGQDAFSTAFQYNDQADPQTGVPKYMTQGQADELAEIAEQARMIADNMTAASEAEEGLFSDEEVERANAFASQLGDVADEGQRAAEAFKNMNLDEMLGRDNGGRVAEGLDVILEKMELLGAESWQITNAKDAFDLASGRESWMGKAFDEQIATQIAASVMGGMSEHLAGAIIKEFDNVMSGAQLQGIDINAPQFQSMVTSTFTNPMFNPDTFNPDEFLAGFQPAADATTTMNSNLSLVATDSEKTGAAFELMAEKTPIITGDISTMETSMGAMVTHTDKIATTLGEISGKKVSIPVELEWLNIGGLVALILPGLVAAVQSAGGIMPGTDQRASTSGPLVRQGQGAY